MILTFVIAKQGLGAARRGPAPANPAIFEESPHAGPRVRLQIIRLIKLRRTTRQHRRVTEDLFDGRQVKNVSPLVKLGNVKGTTLVK